MDTTAIEYELAQLRQRVEQLEADKAMPQDKSMQNLKGALDKAEHIPTKPKFWKQWVVREPRGVEPSFWREGQLLRENSEPVYCFTREMLIEAFRKMKDEYLSSATGIRIVVDNHLKSEGEV